MTTQYAILKGLPNGLALDTGKLFTLAAPDTVVTGNTFGFSNRTNANTQYVVEITRATPLPAGDYTFIAYIGSSPKAEIALTFLGTDGETATETARLAVLDSTRQQALADLAAMITGSGTADAKFDAMALSLAPTGSGGDATLAKQNEILDRLSEVTIGVTGYAQLDIHGVLQLKRGHTATLTFTSDTSNIVSDMSAETVKVFFGIKDAAGRSWLSLEGTKLVNTGLQSVRFTITAALAAAMINGEHFFDVVAVYGYNASTTPKYTSLEPFTSGRAKVTDLYVDI